MAVHRLQSTSTVRRLFPTLSPPIDLGPGEVVEVPDTLVLSETVEVAIGTPLTAGTAALNAAMTGPGVAVFEYVSSTALNAAVAAEVARTTGTYVQHAAAPGSNPLGDLVALGDAIAQAVAAGVPLRLDMGVYNVTGTVAFLDDMYVIADGTTIRKSSGSTSPVSINANRVKVRGLKVDGNGLCSAALSSTGATDLRLEGVTTTGGTDYGFYLSNATKARLRDCLATANGSNDGADAGYYINGTDIRLSACDATSNLGNGFRSVGTVAVPGARHCYVACSTLGNTMLGMLGASTGGVSNGPVNVTITGMTADGNGSAGQYSGISLSYLHGASAFGCVSSNNTEHGIVLMDCTGATVVGNTGRANAKAGLRLQADTSRAQDATSGVTYSTVSSNIWDSNGTANTTDLNTYAAVVIDGPCHDIKFDGNQLVNNRGVSVIVNYAAGYSDPYNLTWDDDHHSGNTAGDDLLFSPNLTDSRYYGTYRKNGTRRPVYYRFGDRQIPTGGSTTMLLTDAVGDVLMPESGRIHFHYFRAERTETVSQVVLFSGATAATGVTLARIGLSTVSSTGDSTRLVTTSSFTGLFAAANTAYQRALQSSVTLQEGKLYALELIVVGTTMASIVGQQFPSALSARLNTDPRGSSYVAVKADLQSGTTVAANHLNSNIRIYAEFLP